MDKFKCRHCKRENDEYINNMFALAYDKCKGKECPDCGKVRKLGVVKIKDYRIARTDCPKCKKGFIDFTLDGLCVECFYGERDDCGCVTHGGAPGYYCSLCKEVHLWRIHCEKCFGEEWITISFNRSYINTKQAWMIAISLFASGAIVGVFLVFFFSRLFKRRKRLT